MEMNEEYQVKIFKAQINKGGSYKGDIISKVLIRITEKYIKSDILDIGAGSGSLVKLLTKRRYNAVGIDLCSRSPIVSYGTITDLKFKDSSFNTVFCSEILEHLTDQQMERGLSEVSRVLKNGRYFIITVPYKEDLDKNLCICPKCRFEFHRFGHLQSFSKERIRYLLGKHGFDIKIIGLYTLGAMAKIPFGKYLNFLFKRFNYDFIDKSIIIVAQKRKH